MKRVTLGKWRRLHQAAGPDGRFTVLAIDHRGPLRLALGREAPHLDSTEALASLKEDIVRALAPAASAVLLDPEIGLRRCLTTGALPGRTALLVAQDTGSTGDPLHLQTGLVPDWSVSDTARVGAAGSKLLVYYHPDAADAVRVEELVSRVAAECADAELPLYLEPLSFAPDRPGEPLLPAERRRVVVETARRLGPLGVDILKLEFPGEIAAGGDEAEALDACAEVSAVSPVPWLLLSGGVDWELFLRQARVACAAGASGVMAGRAFWREAVTNDVPGRRRFLEGAAAERLRRLREVCGELGRGFGRILGVVAGG